MIEQMKVDMETIVARVKASYAEGIEDFKLNAGFMGTDDRKIQELERRVAIRDEMITKLKGERERLI